jgi:GTP-binding protein HflX
MPGAVELVHSADRDGSQAAGGRVQGSRGDSRASESVLFDRPQGGERAVLIHLANHPDERAAGLAEFRELATAAGAEPVAEITGNLQAANPKYYAGSGKAEEIRAAVAAFGAEIALFNHALTPAQERNLERLLQCRVQDRTAVILDIFARRARSFEGKLQVELAQLRHLSTRLVRGWTHLERQRGGIGLRGPGETQLETDRRLIAARIRQIRRRLDQVVTRHAQNRRARQRAKLATVALVGYTNAGKSTLFNALTEAGTLAADQLFATLDPLLRRLSLPQGRSAILADTVGFIRDLPHDLVAAFRATLTEAREATLLLHVIDASHKDHHEQAAEVRAVLAEIGAGALQQIEVYNKIDRLDSVSPHSEVGADGQVTRVWLSAAQGSGLAELRAAIAGRLDDDLVRGWLALAPGEGRLRARLFALGVVLDEQVDSAGVHHLHVNLPRRELARLGCPEPQAAVS